MILIGFLPFGSGSRRDTNLQPFCSPITISFVAVVLLEKLSGGKTAKAWVIGEEVALSGGNWTCGRWRDDDTELDQLCTKCIHGLRPPTLFRVPDQVVV